MSNLSAILKSVEKQMRKKCAGCGMICFMSDVSCKRCSSAELVAFPSNIKSLGNQHSTSFETLGIWNYLLYTGLAVIFEIIATAPIWGLIGSGPGGDSSGILRLAFVLNLPTALITWSLKMVIGRDIWLITPFTQIIFWFCLFVYLGRRRMSKLN